MGLTVTSTGADVAFMTSNTQKADGDKVIALAGNPNVGKSTVFNSLTGLNQHTGNWAGKTVSGACARCIHSHENFILADIPGTYSLMASSVEEQVARDYICFSTPDAIIIVTDATCLERNLNLVLQTLEITKKVVVCVNLLDEAEKKQITVNTDKLSKLLGVPVVGTSAAKNKGLSDLLDTVDTVLKKEPVQHGPVVQYPEYIEDAVFVIEPKIKELIGNKLDSRWVALRLLDSDSSLINSIHEFVGVDLYKHLQKELDYIKKTLPEPGTIKDDIVSAIIHKAEEIAEPCVSFGTAEYNARDRKIDSIITSKRFGYPIMLFLLAVIFWLTIKGANAPSAMLSSFFDYLCGHLEKLSQTFGLSPFWHGLIIDGMYKTVTSVIAVMLPPMAIFFPLFTILEDSGFLPRIAFNLDKYFKCACTCGKQALTMCMGFGCNAAGVVGCRIITSKRERLIAIITNSFVPCNGRFPFLIAVITMFFSGHFGTLMSTLVLTLTVLFSIMMTLLASRFLSKTFLRGEPSSFTLELPPYRVPQIGKVIVRSIFDRTLFVLGRAVMVALPCGAIIWLCANICIDGTSILLHISNLLDPLGRIMGLDGVILLAFILGFPANEIVMPIILMSYMAAGTMVDTAGFDFMQKILTDNGWTLTTALCAIMFSLMHFPCSTTLLTIKKETSSIKWTALSFLLPLICGIICCMIINFVSQIFI